MKTPVHTDRAPKAIGTYSQAIRVGDTVYLSGQIALDPETMQLCDDDIKLQIAQVMENLSAVCEAAGGSLSHLVRITVYLTDLDNFHAVNEAMRRYFVEPYPARVALGVSELPRGSKVEIDGIMVLG